MGSNRLQSISEWIMRLALLNIFWFLFTLLGLILFGLMPATVAAFTVTRQWLTGKVNTPLINTFWNAYRASMIQSNLLGLILVIMACILYLNFSIVMMSEHPLLTVYMVFLMGLIILYVLMIAFLFPVYVHYQLPLFAYLKNALILGITRPLTALKICASAIILYHLFRWIPALIPFFSISLFVYSAMWLTLQTFQKLEK